SLPILVLVPPGDDIALDLRAIELLYFLKFWHLWCIRTLRRDSVNRCRDQIGRGALERRHRSHSAAHSIPHKRFGKEGPSCRAQTSPLARDPAPNWLSLALALHRRCYLPASPSRSLSRALWPGWTEFARCGSRTARVCYPSRVRAARSTIGEPVPPAVAPFRARG